MSNFKDLSPDSQPNDNSMKPVLNGAKSESCLPDWIARKQGQCSRQDYELLPSSLHAQLMNGYILTRPPVSFMHQAVITELLCQIVAYGKESYSPCKAVTFPVRFYLNGGNTILIPDIAIILHPGRIIGYKITEVPFFAAEVVSPDSKDLDYSEKVQLYRKLGVREYWIIDGQKQTVTVCLFYLKEKEAMEEYSFFDRIRVHTLEGLYLDFKRRRE